MTFDPTREVLADTLDDHREAQVAFRESARRARDPRVRLLLEDLARREEELGRQLRARIETFPRKVLDTWHQYTSREGQPSVLRELSFGEDARCESVIEAALRLRAERVDVYRTLADNAEGEEVEQAFRDLVELSENERQRFARSAEEFRHDL